jgi:hypothetical protein
MPEASLPDNNQPCAAGNPARLATLRGWQPYEAGAGKQALADRSTGGGS